MVRCKGSKKWRCKQLEVVKCRKKKRSFGAEKQIRVKRLPIVNENNAAAILAFAALNPHASSRQMEKKVEFVSDLY